MTNDEALAEEIKQMLAFHSQRDGLGADLDIATLRFPEEETVRNVLLLEDDSFERSVGLAGLAEAAGEITGRA